MREIKFRWWDGKDMLYPPALTGDWDMEDCDLLMAYQELRYSIMQYTGLKDKNGQEIYEGDFIAIATEDEVPIPGLPHGPVEEYCQIVNVIFVDGAFGVVMQHDSLFYHQFYTLREIQEDILNDPFEVVGNIYENPELVEE